MSEENISLTDFNEEANSDFTNGNVIQLVKNIKSADNITDSAKLLRKKILSREATQNYLADLFAEKAAGKFLNVGDNNNRSWYHYNGSVWSPNTKAAEAFYKSHVIMPLWEEIQQAKLLDDSNACKQLLKIAKRAESYSFMCNSLKSASSDDRVSLTKCNFDSDPFLLNCKNKTINLKLSNGSKLLLDKHKLDKDSVADSLTIVGAKDHSAADRLSKEANVEFNAEARCPKWEKFLSEIFIDPVTRETQTDVIRFVQALIGYSLTASNTEQVFTICNGKGSNGKSVFLGTIGAILGTDNGYARAISTEVLTSKNPDRESVMSLKDNRFFIASESEDGQVLSSAIIKRATGDDDFTGRHNYATDEENFIVKGKIFLSTNYTPKIRDYTDSIWRRVILLNFNAKFTGANKNKNLKDELLAEASGILNWCIEGCRLWQIYGLDALMPDSVKLAKEEYRAANDHVKQFLNDCCDFEPEASTTAKDLYTAYTEWCISNQISDGSMCKGIATLIGRIERAADVTVGRYRTKLVRGYTGIKVKNAAERNFTVLEASEEKKASMTEWYNYRSNTLGLDFLDKMPIPAAYDDYIGYTGAFNSKADISGFQTFIIENTQYETTVLEVDGILNSVFKTR